MTAAVSADAVGAGSRPSIAGKIVFYALFALADVFAMSKEAFTLGLYLLVVPALALAAIHWGFLLVPLVDWPLTAWRLTRSRRTAILWFGAALVLPLGAPAALNLVQATEFTLDRMGDVAPKQPIALTGPVLILGDCGEVCADLIRSGTFTHLLHREAAERGEWRDGEVNWANLKLASTYCPPRRRPGESVSQLHSRPGWCLVTRRMEQPRYAAVIRLEGYKRAPEPRRQRIEIYACFDGCRLVARQTERRGSRLATPLQIVYRGDSLYLDPQFRRMPSRAGDADPARVIALALGVEPGRGEPRLGEDPVWAAQAHALQAADEKLRRAQTEVERRIRLGRDRTDELSATARRQWETDVLRRRRQETCRSSEFDNGRTFGASCR